MLPQIALEAARRFGDTTAYVAPDGWALSYVEVEQLSDRVAAGFRHRGIGVGDVVALLLPPGVEYLVAYLAAAKVGAITTGVNDRLAHPEQAAVLAVAAP
ncbi:MAG: AMP-binding protein, partial [Acidimicrobiia bacterium]